MSSKNPFMRGLLNVLLPHRWFRRPDGKPSASPAPGTKENKQPVTVIIPVKDGYETFRSCLVAAAKFTPQKQHIIVVDGALNDPRITELAKVIATRSKHVTHARIRGSETVADGVRSAIQDAPGDIILLQSHLRVCQSWVSLLRETAYSAKDIATVSARTIGNETTQSLTQLSSLTKELPPTEGVPSPTGCFYMKRMLIGSETSFDDLTPFWKQAARSGLRHVTDERVLALDTGAPALADQSPAAALRLEESLAKQGKVLLHMDRTEAIKPTIMLVVFVGGGGTPKTNVDLAQGLSATWRVLILEMSPDEWMLSLVLGKEKHQVAGITFPTLVGLGDALPAAHAQQLQAWMQQFAVRTVHFRHWLGTAPEIITAAKQGGAKVVVSLHDFYSVCPALTLMDASGQCCLGNCEAHAAAIQSVGDCTPLESWPGQGAGVTLWHNYVPIWRERVRTAMASADALVTMTQVTQEITCASLPELAPKFHIIEHGRDFGNAFSSSGHFPLPGRAPHFVFIGEGTFMKGADFVIELARKAAELGRIWKFHLVGKVFVQTAELPNLTLHGPYERDALGETLAKLNPVLILLPSRFPETYCHTLTEAWACGIPVLAHKLGALDERISLHGGGWLAERLDVLEWIAKLDAILADAQGYEERRAQACARPFRPISAMTADFLRLYESLG